MVDEIRNMNPLHLMKYKYVVISNPEKGLRFGANWKQTKKNNMKKDLSSSFT
jgi:hypothetical protein